MVNGRVVGNHYSSILLLVIYYYNDGNNKNTSKEEDTRNMKQNLYKFIKTKLTEANLYYKPGFVLAENHYDENDTVKYIIIPWKNFKENAKKIEFEYASSLNLFNEFYIMDKNMSAICEFNKLIMAEDPNYRGIDIQRGSKFLNALPFDIYFSNCTCKSFPRIIIKLLFIDYLVPTSKDYRKDYFVWYKNGNRFLVFNLSNEAVRVQLGDSKEAILHYDTRPKECNMVQENQYIEKFTRMLTKIAPKDMQIILYIGVCPLSGDEEYVKNAIIGRKNLAYKLSLRYKNVTPVYDYREMKIPE